MRNSRISVKNIGDKKIYDVTVTSQKGFWFSYGVIIPNTTARYIGSYEYPYNDKYTVEWVDFNAKSYKESVDLHSIIPRYFSEDAKLIFQINKNNELAFEFVNPGR
jgi:hypothetical protein